MRVHPIRTVVVTVIAMLLGAGEASAQVPVPPPPPSEQAAPQFTAEQLDQLLAPIALYPDPLLAQILMAASYPLEVVQADRWLQDPANAALKNDELTVALSQLPWDPSVKSLVPFPEILLMMDNDIDWTQRLGDAFVADQSAVMDSVQHLRQRAEAAGKLNSTPQQAVTTEDQAITIEPTGPGTVYVPVYDPTVAYGPWPYPSYPPYDFPDYFDGTDIDGLGFGWFGVAVVAPLWGWHHWDWAHRRIDIDRGRFAALDRSHPPFGGDVWQHDPSRRHGVVNPGMPARFAGVSPPRPNLPRIIRGAPPRPTAQVEIRPQGAIVRPQVIRPQMIRPQMIRPQTMSPAFRPSGFAVGARIQAEQARAGRMPPPMFRPAGGAPHAASPSAAAARR
jgi:hypothetical protein